MAHELIVPEVGESIRDVQIAKWLKHEGQWADKDEPLVEIETDKATVELPSPAAGVVSRILKGDGESAEVGEIIGYLEEAAAPAPEVQAGAASRPGETESPEEPAAARDVAAPAGQRVAQTPAEPPAVPEQQPEPSPPPILSAAARQEEHVFRQEQRVPMSPIRRRIAEHLVAAQQTAALLTTFNEIDMTAVIELRRRHGEAFQEQYGTKLGFMSFFVKAVIEGLKLCPQLNAEIQGGDIVYRNYYDIGVAIGGGKGLVVPCLRNAERMSFAEIERAIADLAGRARQNKLKLEELEGGTFTITNGGVYGSLLSTPIVNPPQSGILGMHAIQDRPVARDGAVVIRPMMYVALTYDHRLVDGREAVGFLTRVKQIVEEPSRMLLEI